MTRIRTGDWIVIADGEKALFLVNDGDEDFPNFNVIRKEKQRNPPTREQGTDTPGRFNDGPSVQRSAVNETDWHRFEKDRFARDLSEILYSAAHRGEFQRLVVAASPKVLGTLRSELHEEVAGRITVEVPKTLTNHPLDEVEALLIKEVA
jgi:protein required for attachment to host cells